MKKILYRGAEAIIYKVGDKLVKERISKTYRHPVIDKAKRLYPTRKEFKILTKLQGILKVPKIYSVDETTMTLVMEPINGKVLKNIVDSFSSEELKTIFIQLGKEIVKMHNVNIVHGDLTTANILVKDKELYFIDFGLGSFSNKIEDKAVDLRVLRQALESKHHIHPSLFSFVLEGYSTTQGSKEVIQRLYSEVETRGRYKRKNK